MKQSLFQTLFNSEFYRNVSLLLVCFLLFSGSSDEATRAKGEIMIHEGDLYLKGIKVTSPWELDKFTDAFGKPDRVNNSTNIVHTWDNLGFKVFQSTKSKLVLEIQIVFDSSTTSETDPENSYIGKFLVEGNELNEHTSLQTLKKYLPDYDFSKDDYSNRGENKGIYIYWNESENGTDASYYSFGQDDGDAWR